MPVEGVKQVEVLLNSSIQPRWSAALQSWFNPILQSKAFDLRELSRIVRDQNHVHHMRMAPDKCIERPDGFAAPR